MVNVTRKVPSSDGILLSDICRGTAFLSSGYSGNDDAELYIRVCPEEDQASELVLRVPDMVMTWLPRNFEVIPAKIQDVTYSLD